MLLTTNQSQRAQTCRLQSPRNLRYQAATQQSAPFCCSFLRAAATRAAAECAWRAVDAPAQQRESQTRAGQRQHQVAVAELHPPRSDALRSTPKRTALRAKRRRVAGDDNNDEPVAAKRTRVTPKRAAKAAGGASLATLLARHEPRKFSSAQIAKVRRRSLHSLDRSSCWSSLVSVSFFLRCFFARFLSCLWPGLSVVASLSSSSTAAALSSVFFFFFLRRGDTVSSSLLLVLLLLLASE